jgi:hypothetical protein
VSENARYDFTLVQCGPQGYTFRAQHAAAHRWMRTQLGNAGRSTFLCMTDEECSKLLDTCAAAQFSVLLIAIGGKYNGSSNRL